MRVLVTGASGYVGRALAEQLVLAEHDVVTTRYLREVDVEGVDVVDSDVRDSDQVRQAVEGVDTVVHSAALVGASHGMADLKAVNVEGTRNIMDACIDFDVGHVVYISSTCVMDEYVDHFRSDESHPYPSEERDCYTRTKVEAERHVLGCSDRLKVTVLRPGWVWGPGAPGMYGLVRALDKGLFAMPGRGDNILHLVYRDNLASVIGQVVDGSALGKFIITDGSSTDLGTFLGCIRRCLGKDPRVPSLPFGLVYHVSAITGPIGRSLGIGLPDRLQMCNIGRNHEFDNRRSREVLGYEPVVGLEEGVARTVEWYREVRP